MAVTPPSREEKSYISQLMLGDVLTVEQEADLVSLHRDGDHSATAELIAAHEKLVVKLARKYCYYGQTMSDLIGEGTLALYAALERFDPSKGRFCTLAGYYVMAALQNYTLHNHRMVRISDTSADKRLFFRWVYAQRDAVNALNREGVFSPSEDDVVAKLAEMMQMSDERIRQINSFASIPTLSLDSALDVDQGSSDTYLDFLTDDTCVERSVSAVEQKEIVTKALQRAMEELDDRERQVIQQRFFADEKSVFRDLGNEFGISKERARQIEVRAIGKLRRSLELLRVNICDYLVDAC